MGKQVKSKTARNQKSMTDHPKKSKRVKVREAEFEASLDAIEATRAARRIAKADLRSPSHTQEQELTSAVIWLHGLGDRGASWDFLRSAMKDSATHVKWVFPDAPKQPVSANGGFKMSSWFDMKAIPVTPNAWDDKAGLSAVVEKIHSIVAKLEKRHGILPERIVVGGFSQGGCAGLLAALTCDKKLAGAVCLSGWLARSDEYPALIHQANANTSIFWGHGDEDDKVLFSTACKGREILSTVSGALTFKAYAGMGHESNQTEEEELRSWLVQLLPKRFTPAACVEEDCMEEDNKPASTITCSSSAPGGGETGDIAVCGQSRAGKSGRGKGTGTQAEQVNIHTIRVRKKRQRSGDTFSKAAKTVVSTRADALHASTTAATADNASLRHTTPTPIPIPFCIDSCVAPMVGGSDLPFRMLCRRHGASCCWTEMIYADRFVSDVQYRQAYLEETAAGDRPLVVQICGHDPDTLRKACRLIRRASFADAVDLNLGCPQKRAEEGHYGAYLLQREHWPTVLACVRAMVEGAGCMPVSCKIRLCSRGVPSEASGTTAGDISLTTAGGEPASVSADMSVEDTVELAQVILCSPHMHRSPPHSRSLSLALSRTLSLSLALALSRLPRHWSKPGVRCSLYTGAL
jgi:predicted esterase